MSDDGEDNITSPEQRASGRAWPSLAGKAGRSAACGYHAPGRSAGMAARLMVMSCGGGEGGTPTCQPPAARGLVAEPVAVRAAGNAVADMRSLPAGLGKTQRPVDRGAGGNRRQSALPCGTRRLPPTRPAWTLGKRPSRSRPSPANSICVTDTRRRLFSRCDRSAPWLRMFESSCDIRN